MMAVRNALALLPIFFILLNAEPPYTNVLLSAPSSIFSVLLSAASEGGNFLLSSGTASFIEVGFAIVVVSTKKEMSKNPRSTMGVRSTRSDAFRVLGTPDFCWCLLCRMSDIVFIHEMKCCFHSIKDLEGLNFQ